MPRSLLMFFITVLSLALAGGCTDDLRGRNLFDAGADEATIRFSVANISLSRASDTGDIESNIDYAYLLFYPEDATVGTSVPIAAVKAEVSTSDLTALTFKMPLSLKPATDYKLLALANADEYIPEGFNSFADYLQSWSTKEVDERGELILIRNDRIPSNGGILPMLGEVTEGNFFRFSMQNGGYEMSSALSFRRMVARIDVANIVKAGFSVEGVALCNWRNAVSVASILNNKSNRSGSVNGILSDNDANVGDGIFIEMPEADESGIQQLQRAAYCLPSVCNDSYASDSESTALIIKAKYGEDTESTYYRVNVGMSGNNSEVKANTKYLLTIQSVKGRGASTVKEAYASEESPIVLSVVEEWDLDGSFAMDDKGNFIVLSTGNLEFDGDDKINKKEVKVLTSKGLSWGVEYVADNAESETAFIAARLSDTSLAIGPAEENIGESVLSGRFIVTAVTSDNDKLSVNISVSQKAMEEEFVEPTIPDDMPFALIPQSYERVKINHVDRTIEIDGFDPDCFNSFIDIPFTVYRNKENESADINIEHTLVSPVEGTVSKTKLGDDCYYCSSSFGSTLKVYSKSKKNELGISQVIDNYGNIFSVGKDDIIYISVGAMAPDDPAIERTVTISKMYSIESEKINYKLTIKPRPVIIDDVVITDDNGNRWIICDRNIQDTSSSFAGRKSDGSKYQAYNYLNQLLNPITIPFKFEAKDIAFDESKHMLYKGASVTYSNRSDNASSRTAWLQKYIYSDDHTRTSPFYEKENSDKWKFPDESLMRVCSQIMRVSKLRMFLVSDIPVKSGRDYISVCCYWPYDGYPMDKFSVVDLTYGYYVDNSGTGNTDSMVYIYCDKTQMMLNTPSSEIGNKFPGLLRLVRPLTDEELENYKNTYLGYGSQSHKLTICHPDTYTSDGWIPN